MVKGKTTTGFEFETNEAVFNDMEVVDAIADMQTGDESAVMVATSVLITKLLGAEQKKALYNHLRNDEGRVPIESVSNAIVEIMTSCKNGKK